MTKDSNAKTAGEEEKLIEEETKDKKDSDSDEDDYDPDMAEHVEIHLDGCGKRGLTFVFALMQFSSIFTFCIFYY